VIELCETSGRSERETRKALRRACCPSIIERSSLYKIWLDEINCQLGHNARGISRTFGKRPKPDDPAQQNLF